MKRIRKILSGAITMVMMYTMVTSFSGSKVQAKEGIPKYTVKEELDIQEACMYEDKAIVRYRSGGINYYEGRNQMHNENATEVGNKISKEEMYYNKNYTDKFIYNFKDKTSVSTKSIEDNMKKFIKEKYSFDMEILRMIKSENRVYWGEFADEYKKKRGVVSSKGDLIEVPFTPQFGAVDVKIKDNAVYIFNHENNTLSIITSTEKKEYKIDIKEAGINLVDQLHVNKDGIYFLRAQPIEYCEKGKILKVQLKDGKGDLKEIAQYNNIGFPISIDNNDNIWYLESGLIYKIENDKPTLKYEVDKDAENLFVSDDNNFIASKVYSGDVWNIIVNLSDKYINGWVKENGKWSYYENRRRLSDEWKEIDGKWYSFDYKGIMMTGWTDDAAHNMYYLKDDGQMVTGWKKIDGNWYYFKDNGQAMRRWGKIDGKWYYFNNDCQMITGWQEINGIWYYLNNDGEAATEWKQVDGTWYYFNNDCQMVVEWQKINGKWYYFYNNGSMAHDTVIEGYKIGTDGAML